MEPSKRVQFWGSLVFCTGLAVPCVKAQDEPPLLPPELTAPSGDSRPSVDSSKPADSPKTDLPAASAIKPPESRPLLIIPGVTAPSSNRRPATPRATITPPATSVEGEDLQPIPSPRLESPSRTTAPRYRQTPPQVRGNDVAAPDRDSGASPRPRIAVPLSLEPIPDGADDAAPPQRMERGGRNRAGSTPVRTPTTTMTAPVVGLEEEPERGEEPGGPRRAPATGGVFGRFFDQSRLDSMRSVPKNEIKVERRSDPASETALRRRVDQQIRDQLGDKVSDLEVRIVGKTIVVRGRTTRFWQRRSVRRSLESLPSISGYQTRIELD